MASNSPLAVQWLQPHFCKHQNMKKGEIKNEQEMETEEGKKSREEEKRRQKEGRDLGK